MNTNYTQLHAEALQSRFSLRVAARLSEATEELPHDIRERLRVGREQAVARRKRPVVVLHPRVATTVSRHGNAAALGGDRDGLGFWGRLTSMALALFLVVGLVAIDVIQENDRTLEVAELDAALLTDDLPPEAYADPGFLQYLKSGMGTTDTSNRH